MATINEIVGFLKLKGGEQFSRDLKGRLAGVRESFLSINNAIAGTGLVLFLKNVNESANSLSQANRQLAATSKLTGVDLGTLTSIAKNAESTFKLSTQQANQFTIAVSKLTGKAGDLGKTGDAIGRLLDLAAAQGLDAEQALIAINQAILGIDEGTDKLFQKNPSAIYEEYAKQIGTTAGKLNDQEKAQALLNAVMNDGLKVQGEYQSFLNDAPGKQALLATALQKTSAAVGQMVQTGLTPLLELVTDLVNWFNSLSEAGKNLVVALGAVTTAAYLFGGALRVLLPMIGPVGWLLTGLSVAAGLFFGLQSKTQGAAQGIDAAAESLNKFRTGLTKLSAAEAMMKLTWARIELRSVQTAFENAAFNTAHNQIDKTLTANLLNRKKELQGQIKELQKFVLESAERGNIAPAPVNKKADEEAKARLDNQRDFEFENQQISREQYLAYLQTRQQDFTKWDNDWLGAQQEIIKLKGFYSEEELKKAREMGTGIIEVFRKQDEETQKHHQNNFANSMAALDSQAKFEADTNEISREQYLDYLRARLDDFAVWSEEWISRKREIFQLETEAQRQEAEKQKAILQEQRDQAMNIAGDLRNGIAAIGLAIAESIKIGGDAFKAFWKAVLTTALEAIERYFLLAKIKSIIEAVINPFSALKNAAPLIIAAGLLQVAKARIAALAEGTVATKPTLAMIGEGRSDAFEVVAPQRKFDAFTDELLQRALARGIKFSTGAAAVSQNVGRTINEVVQSTNQNISHFVNNFFTPMANVALAGANPLPRVEAMAPAATERVARSGQRQSSEREARAGRNERGHLVINNHFASPLNDRRTAVRLTDEVLRPEVKRELRREERKLQSAVFSE